MLTARITAPFTIDFPEKPIPKVEAGKVLLKIKYLGICASDIQIYHGKHKYVKFPLTMGHEASCEIVAVGEGVEGFRVGDHVVVEPQLTCGVCPACRRGRFNVCESLKVIGVHTDGMAAEYFLISPENLHLLPEGLDMKKAALIEPLAVGFGSVRRAGDVTGANVAVVGAGTIGCFTAQAAKALGAAHVLLTDIVDKKLDIARACGVEYCVNTRESSLKQAVSEYFGDEGADVIIDCAATPFVFGQMIEAARTNSVIIITGNYKDDVTLEMPLIQRREISVIGHMMYVRREFEDAIRFLADGSIKTESVISMSCPLSDYSAAFEYIDAHSNEVMKVIMEVG